jgi:hypothetical protein
LSYQNELGKTIEYEEGELQDNGRIKLEFPNETLQPINDPSYSDV